MTPREWGTLSRLFDQQMWAFGRDVESPHGNLLVAFGLRRVPVEGRGGVSSDYVGDTIALSSAGLTFGAARLERGPGAPHRLAEHRGDLAGACAWLARYERWVEARHAGWRALALSQRRRPPAFAASDVPLLFDDLRAQLTSQGSARSMSGCTVCASSTEKFTTPSFARGTSMATIA